MFTVGQLFRSRLRLNQQARDKFPDYTGKEVRLFMMNDVEADEAERLVTNEVTVIYGDFEEEWVSFTVPAAWLDLIGDEE